MAAPVIGIDLGTTFSCVGVFQHGKIQIIANGQGSTITPSCVAFNDFEILIGEEAKSQVTLNPINTVFDVKRLIGRKYNDLTVQNDIKHWPFNVKDVSGKPVIEVKYKNETKSFAPEEISAMILTNMKELAESHLGMPIRDAVITVPAYFNDSQRQATIDAGTIAGLNVLRIINEPTAAAIAYGLENISNTMKNTKVLIFDLGGGTFDVSVLNIQNGIIEVISTNGNTHLGGEDFDNRLVDYFLNEFKRKYKKDINNHRSLRRLRTACEMAKRTLSTYYQANIDIDSLFEGIHFSSTINRSIFEELCTDLFKFTIESVEKSMSGAKLDNSEIQQVILVGGSTRIPKIQKLLQDYFGGKELYKSINPNEAVCYGAAVQAAMLNDGQSKEIKYLSILDIAPLSLGIETVGGKLSTIIKRNTNIPTKIERTCSIFYDNQDSILFSVYEGENSMTEHNNLLGQFILKGIAKVKPKDSHQIRVTFDIDPNCIFNIAAVNNISGNSDKITIKNEKGHPCKEEVKRMVLEAEKYNKDIKTRRKILIAKNNLQSLCFHIKSSLEVTRTISKLLQEEVTMLKEEIERTLSWINNMKNTLSKEDFEHRQKIIGDVWDQIANKLKSESSNFSPKDVGQNSLISYNLFLRAKHFLFSSSSDGD